MKTTKQIFSTVCAALFILAACQPVEFEEISGRGNSKNANDSVWFLTVQATKEISGQAGNDGGTKALDLTDSGQTLNAYWVNNASVKVYKGNTCVGTLKASPDETNSALATLSGEVTVSGLNDGEELTLMVPSDTWAYTGQVGTIAGISDKFDYATAVVKVNGISGNNITTSGAVFANEQSIYRFGFKNGSSYIDPKDFVVSANGGKLVQSLNLSGSTWTPTYGSITVTPSATPADHFYYVSLRNESTTDDTYRFIVIGSNDALYLASKAIPASVLNVPGKFISAKEIAVSQPSFAPASGIIDKAEDVF